jgi:transposase InsO family protein
MPWKETRVMDLRVQLLQEYDEGETVSALAEAYGVSRKTVHKWINRREEEGVAGLQDRSRAPHTSPHQISREVIDEILVARRKWKWGPRKLLRKLAQADPQRQDWPAPSTIAAILKQAGLSAPRKGRLRTPLFAKPFAAVEQANQTWCADFKGWFRTLDGTRCDPLTITDAHSRYLLRCQITPKTDGQHVAAIFEAAFREYGLPEVIRTDNGTPFATRAPGGLSRLSMRWVRLGIVPERTAPASPQENGRHERMHRTLKQDALNPPAANPRQQQKQFHEFQRTYNEERPHEALSYATPAQHYQHSTRSMPRRLPEVEYPEGYIIRRIHNHGDLFYDNQRFFISEIFARQPLGLKPVDDRHLEVFYGMVRLGWLEMEKHRFSRKKPKVLEGQKTDSDATADAG